METRTSTTAHTPSYPIHRPRAWKHPPTTPRTPGLHTGEGSGCARGCHRSFQPCSCSTQKLYAYGIWVARWRLDDRGPAPLSHSCMSVCAAAAMGGMDGHCTVRYLKYIHKVKDEREGGGQASGCGLHGGASARCTSCRSAWATACGPRNRQTRGRERRRAVRVAESERKKNPRAIETARPTSRGSGLA